jgi:hypothetical protein
MTLRGLAFALVLACGLPAARAAPIELTLVDEVGLAPDERRTLEQDFATWGERVYAYLDQRPGPVRAIVTRRVAIGYYSYGKVYVPYTHRTDMIETWVHELAHHATGHDSSFFFKEGIAVHATEKLLREGGIAPASWPQYGRSVAEWVTLFQERGELPTIEEALQWPGFRGRTREQDFRSWQIYIIAGAFAGWYIEQYGVDAFHRAFAQQRLVAPAATLERRWLASVPPLADFDPAATLPDRSRFRYFVQRLS